MSTSWFASPLVHVPQVRAYAALVLPVEEGEAYGVGCVVGGGEGEDAQPAQVHVLVALEHAPLRGVHPHEGRLHGAPCVRVGVHGDMVLPGEHGDAPDMVDMLVGHQYGVQVPWVRPHLGHELRDPAAGDPGVDEQPGVPGLDIGGVSRGTAAQGHKTHTHLQL